MFCHGLMVIIVPPVPFYSSSEVLTTLTTDVGKVMAKLQQVQPKGEVNFVTGVRIAHVSIDPFLPPKRESLH